MSQHLDFEKLDNTRDLGGMPAAGGRVIRRGRLLRSGLLQAASEADRRRLAGEVGRIVDFRTATEREVRPDPAIPGVENIHLPIVDEVRAGITREEEADETALRSLIFDPEMARQHMCGIYADFITSSYSVSQYAAFVALLRRPVSGATLWHCTAGKDRAGFAAVIVEEILGVDRDLIVEDYMASNRYLTREIEAILDRVREHPEVKMETAEEAVGYLFGAKTEYIDILYKRIAEYYGDFEGFLEKGLRVGGRERAELRELYLE